MTVVSDGEAALPNLVKAALNQSVTHILDWWHISMRVRHIENVFKGVVAGAVDLSEEQREIANLVDRIRWQIWHNKHANTLESLHRIQQLCAKQKPEDNIETELSAAMVSRRCPKLETYLTRNRSSLTNYGQRYRSGRPISSSRAEGCVDDIANARMGKRRRIRWSPRGAHRVAVTRAAILGGK